MQDIATPPWDFRGDSKPDFFTDPAIGADPKAYFDRLRSRCPVIKEDYHGSLMVTGYDEVMAVLNRRDDVFSAAVSTLGPIPPLPFEPQGDDIREQLDAHRDELQEPENFHMDRSKVRDHLAFSRGPHMCPGSTLARIEGRVALERILARTANIRISEAHHGAPEERRFRFEPTYSFRGLSELHIEFTPA